MFTRNHGGGRAVDPKRLPICALSLFVSGTLDLICNGERCPIPLVAPTLAAMIMPEQRIPRALRRGWEAAKRRVVIFEDDSPAMGGFRGPLAFDPVAIQWAARNAGGIVVWESGAEPHIVAAVAALLSRHPVAAIALTNVGHARDWYKALEPLSRTGCEFVMALATGGAK